MDVLLIGRFEHPSNETARQVIPREFVGIAHSDHPTHVTELLSSGLDESRAAYMSASDDMLACSAVINSSTLIGAPSIELRTRTDNRFARHSGQSSLPFHCFSSF